MSYISYQHKSKNASPIDLPAGKVVCIGRNYLNHIRELGNSIPDQALLFMKPSTALTSFDKPLCIPTNLGACHNEVELALLIKSTIVNESNPVVLSDMIWGLGLGLDLTLRDLQTSLKSSGQPWERAKAFDGSCPISSFIPLAEFEDINDLDFSLSVNGKVRQQGNTANMMRSIEALIHEITESFTLLPGDIILTGTPAGVGELKSGDKLALSLANRYKFACEIL